MPSPPARPLDQPTRASMPSEAGHDGLGGSQAPVAVAGSTVAAYRAAIGLEVGPGNEPAVPLTYFMVTSWPALVATGTALLAAEGAEGSPLTLVRYELHTTRPLVVGETVTTSVRLVGRSAAPGGSLLCFAHGTRAGPEEVAQQRSTVLVQGLTSDQVDRTLLRRSGRPRHGEPRHADLHLPHDVAERFAAASGDLNPIHLDDDAARAAGFDGAVVHGMCLLARVLATLPLSGGDRYRSLGCQFGSPARPGDRVQVTSWSTGAHKAPDIRFRAAVGTKVALKDGWVTR